jgi:hypothetical protein
MFEGKPPKNAEGHAIEGQRDGESLRPLSWGDLVARLTAARDLRASLADRVTLSDASFDASSARCVAAHHNGKHLVNPEDSGSGKGLEAIASQAVHGAASGVARN